jgi:hypothetical protein
MSTQTSEVSDEHGFVLATEAPTSAQRRLALAVAAAIFATFGVTLTIGLTAPFARTQVIVIGFVPALTAVFFVNDLITATLLFGQFSIISFTRTIGSRRWIFFYGTNGHSICAHVSRCIFANRSSWCRCAEFCVGL